MMQIGCETCLRLQKLYSEALRRYADALGERVLGIQGGNYTPDSDVLIKIERADRACSTARRALEQHEVEAHAKIAKAKVAS